MLTPIKYDSGEPPPLYSARGYLVTISRTRVSPYGTTIRQPLARLYTITRALAQRTKGLTDANASI